MVDLIFVEDNEALTKPGIVRTIYDPAAGTGGMLSVAEEHLTAMNPEARLTMYGQELNPESFAICKADMLIKGQDVGNIVFGNTFSEDGQGDAGGAGRVRDAGARAACAKTGAGRYCCGGRQSLSASADV